MTPSSSAQETTVSFRGWWALGVFTLALLLSYADRQILNLLIDPVRHTLDISDTQISVLQGAAFGIFYAVGGVPFGRAADLWSRHAVIAFGILGWSAATFLCGVASTFGQLFAARILVGIGEASLLPAAMSLLANFFPLKRRGTAIGILLVGAAAGTGLSTFAAGHLIAAIGPDGAKLGNMVIPAWRAAFILVSLAGVPMALLILTVGKPDGSQIIKRAVSMRRVLTEFRELGSGLGYLYGAIGALTLSNFALLSWTPALLSRQFGQTPAQVGNGFGAAALLAGVSGTLFIGVAGDRMVRATGAQGRLWIAVFMPLLGLLSVGLASTSSPGAALVIVAVAAFGSTAALTLCSAGLQDVVPDSVRGVATALVSLIATTVGLSVGPTLVAVATQYIYGGQVALGIATVVPPASAAACLLLHRARQLLYTEARHTITIGQA